MSFSKYKTWNFGEVLTSADLNASFDAIENQEQDIGTPRTQAFDMDGQELILDADADTSITADTDDRIDFRIQGQDLFKMNGTAATSVNGLTWVASATGNPAQIQAHGSDANIGITLVPKGTGALTVTATTGSVAINTTTATVTATNIVLDASSSVDIDGAQLILDADADSSIRETSDDVLTMKLQNVDSFVWNGAVASPVNGLTFTSSATTVDPSMGAHGSDSVINVRLAPKSTGVAACAGGWAVDGATNLTWRWQGSGASLLLQENTGTATSPTWTTRNTYATGVGISSGCNLLATYTPSNAATVDITSVISATYSVYLICYTLVPATDGDSLFFRTSTNNGSSFDAGAGNYAYGGANQASGGGAVAGYGNDNATSMQINGTAMDNVLGCSGKIWIDFIGSGTRFPSFTWDYRGTSSAANAYTWTSGAGFRQTAAAINAVRLLMSSGNLTGTVKVYGLAAA